MPHPLGQLLLQRVDHGVGVEAQRGRLPAQGLHVVRVGMAYGNDGMSAVEVEVFGAVVIPHMAAFSFYYVDVKEWIYVEKSHIM